MKLRIRAASGGATFRVEVPVNCSLRMLRETIGQSLVSNDLPFSTPIRISLNKTEEMRGPDSTLLSQYGVRGGDLLYYFDSQGLYSFMNEETVAGDSVKRCDAQITVHGSARVSAAPAGTAEAMEIVPQESRGTACSGDPDMASSRRELCASAATKRASLAGQSSTDSEKTFHPGAAEDVCASLGDASHNATSSTPASDIHAKNLSQYPHTVVGSGIEASPIEVSDSIPIILQRVLVAEARHVSGPDVLLILAVHAAMIETGFIVWNATVEGSAIPSGWFRRGTVDLHYTLSEIAHGVQASDVGHVILNCQTVGRNVVIYGTISGDTQLYRLNLQTSKYIVRREEKTNFDPSVAGNDISSSFLDLFGLWQGVKDCLSLPLLTVLCERAGLPVPPSLLRIPIELKMKILECLPALDLSKLGCTCSELRHLSANDELWKVLFSKEFGSASGQKPPGFRGWKEAFQHRFSERKRALKRPGQSRRLQHYGMSSRLPLYRGFPRIGGVIGGDYDMFPNFGSAPFRGGLGGPRGPLGHLYGRLSG